MDKINIDEIIDKYEDYDDKYFHEAELLIIFFNFWPEVQRKMLKRLKLSDKEIEIVMSVSDKYAKKKARLIRKKVPLNREGVILIENDVIKDLFFPKIIKIRDVEGDEYETLKRYFKMRYKKAVVMDRKKIDEFEKILNLEGESVDFLIFTKDKIYSYVVEIT